MMLCVMRRVERVFYWSLMAFLLSLWLKQVTVNGSMLQNENVTWDKYNTTETVQLVRLTDAVITLPHRQNWAAIICTRSTDEPWFGLFNHGYYVNCTWKEWTQEYANRTCLLQSADSYFKLVELCRKKGYHHGQPVNPIDDGWFRFEYPDGMCGGGVVEKPLGHLTVACDSACSYVGQCEGKEEYQSTADPKSISFPLMNADYFDSTDGNSFDLRHAGANQAILDRVAYSPAAMAFLGAMGLITAGFIIFVGVSLLKMWIKEKKIRRQGSLRYNKEEETIDLTSFSNPLYQFRVREDRA